MDPPDRLDPPDLKETRGLLGLTLDLRDRLGHLDLRDRPDQKETQGLLGLTLDLLDHPNQKETRGLPVLTLNPRVLHPLRQSANRSRVLGLHNCIPEVVLTDGRRCLI